MNTLPHYGKKGILDVTHTRFFPFRSVRELLKQSGYQFSKLAGGSETDGEQFAARNDLGQRRIESRSAWRRWLNGRGLRATAI